MERPDYNSPSSLRNFLSESGMGMQKKFGQNFMVSSSARKRIADLLSPGAGELVWEVGPGLGCMTDEMLSRGASVLAFEIDRGFIAALRSFFGAEEKSGRIRISEGDVLRNWRPEADKSLPAKIFGNLPYNIAATFIADTISAGVSFERCVFTVQKEVALRMAARPSSESYSSFSVLCQLLYDVRLAFELAPGNFWPKPNVSSEAVVMERKKSPPVCSDMKLLLRLVRALFASRRKTLLNNIRPIVPAGVDASSVFSGAGISPSERAENLGVGEFILLSESLASAIISRGGENDGNPDCGKPLQGQGQD